MLEATDTGKDAHLILDGVSKRYSGTNRSVQALENVNLTVDRREFVSIIGQSGCGKTTLLRIIAGLESPTEGRVLIDDRPLWVGPTRQEGTQAVLGVVFQEPRLFPWYSIRDNVALPMTLRGSSKKERYRRASELCALVGLGGFEGAYPRELSGGMQQRASIARALANEPEILLMDEPFGALDAITRESMNLELQRIQARTGVTVVFVTHSITEAVFLATRVVLLSPRPGRIRSITDIAFGSNRELEIQTTQEFQEIVRTLRPQLAEVREENS